MQSVLIHLSTFPVSHGFCIRFLSSESESELLYDWQFIANQFFLAPRPLRLTAKYFFTLRLTVSQSVKCRAPSGAHDQIFIII
jgi:hypothetical protein